MQDLALESARVLAGCAVIAEHVVITVVPDVRAAALLPRVLAAGRGAAILRWLCNWL